MTATSAPPRPPTRPPSTERRAPNRPQRLLFGLALVLVLGAGLVAAAVFVWPSSASDDLQVNFGSIEQFPPGTVTTFLWSRSGPLPAGSSSGIEPPLGPTPGTFHIVRLESGEVLALSARDPHLGCTVPFRPTFEFDGREGWFRNPCHGETYDMAGFRIFGPAPRGLDRFAVEVRGSSVHVDFGELTAGPPPQLPPGYEFQTGGVPGPLNGRR